MKQSACHQLNSVLRPLTFLISVFQLISIAAFMLSLVLERISHVPFFFSSFILVSKCLLVHILSFIADQSQLMIGTTAEFGTDRDFSPSIMTLSCNAV